MKSNKKLKRLNKNGLLSNEAFETLDKSLAKEWSEDVSKNEEKLSSLELKVMLLKNGVKIA